MFGKNIPTSRTEEIIVHMTEIDQQDAVLLVEANKSSTLKAVSRDNL